MNLDEAKEILFTATKSELRDHAFGDCEVEWYIGKADVANGYFSGSMQTVSFADGGSKFSGSDADELRKCFLEEVVERNDETGPDEFVVGKIMPGLTKEGVFKELTGN